MNVVSASITQAQLVATAYVVGAFHRLEERRERGQGSVEYAGIVFIVAAIVAAVIVAARSLQDTQVAQALMDKLAAAVNKVK